MKYDYKKIGERIRKERKALHETQEVFAERFKVKRSTVGFWEKGTSLPNFQTMVDMCELLGCEMGYLLCEPGYENRTRNTTDISAETGLSEDAVNMLKKCTGTPHTDFINRYITEGREISESIQRLKDGAEPDTDRIKYMEFAVTDSFLDLVKAYIK